MIPRNWRPGIIPPSPQAVRRTLLSAPAGWAAPWRVDSTSLCRPADNQANIPSCGGWAAANHGEVWTWAETKSPPEYVGLAVYYGSKRIDGHPNEDGTDGISAMQAAITLKLFPTTAYVPIKGWRPRWLNTMADLKFALHRYRTCCGFFTIRSGWNENNEGRIGTGGDSLGGHAVLMNWYDDREVGWLNQWGLKTGVDGNQRTDWDTWGDQWQGGCVCEPIAYPVPIGESVVMP